MPRGGALASWLAASPPLHEESPPHDGAAAAPLVGLVSSACPRSHQERLASFLDGSATAPAPLRRGGPGPRGGAAGGSGLLAGQLRPGLEAVAVPRLRSSARGQASAFFGEGYGAPNMQPYGAPPNPAQQPYGGSAQPPYPPQQQYGSPPPPPQQQPYGQPPVQNYGAPPPQQPQYGQQPVGWSPQGPGMQQQPGQMQQAQPPPPGMQAGGAGGSGNSSGGSSWGLPGFGSLSKLSDQIPGMSQLTGSGAAGQQPDAGGGAGGPMGPGGAEMGPPAIKSPHGTSNAALFASVGVPVGLALGGATVYFKCCRRVPDASDYGDARDNANTEYEDSDYDDDSHK